MRQRNEGEFEAKHAENEVAGGGSGMMAEVGKTARRKVRDAFPKAGLKRSAAR